MYYIVALFLGYVVLNVLLRSGIKRSILVDFFFVSLALVPIFSLSAMQYEVGTDYNEYYHMTTNGHMERFLRKGEPLYYFLGRFVELMGVNQLIFVFSSILNFGLFAVTLLILHRAGYKVSIIFFLFFTVTGLHHNQMNGLRQYTAIFAFILLSVLLSIGFRRLALIIPFSIGFLSHSTFLLSLPVFLVRRLLKFNLSVIFFSTVGYISVPYFIELLVQTLAPQYLGYLGSSYGDPVTGVNLLTKFIPLPFFIYFLYVYIKNVGFRSSFLRSHAGFDTLLVLWCFTGTAFISMIHFGFMFRFSQYFIFFHIFPIYYLIRYMFKTGRENVGFIIVLTLFSLYALKVVVFPVREYAYRSIVLF